MKILMTAETFYPFMGGIETHILSLSKYLCKLGHEVVICTVNQRGLPAYEEDGRTRIYRLEGLFQKVPLLHRNKNKKTHPPSYDPIFSRRIKDILLKEKPDVIHSHDWTLYSVIPLKKRFNIPIVCTLHGYHFVCPNKSLLNKTDVCLRPSLKNCLICMSNASGLLRALPAYIGVMNGQKSLNAVDRFVSVSAWTRDIHLRFLKINQDRVSVIPNFLEPEKVEIDGKTEFPEDFILFVGNLSPAKGVDVLLEAYQRLKTRTKLVLIGYRHSDFHYTGSDGVIIKENLPGQNVMQAMARCRFAVFPSRLMEAFGIVAIEAMSHKKAVIATAIGGLQSIVVDGQTGILVKPGDANQLCEAIQKLLADPELAKEMGLKGYKRLLEKYTSDSVIPEIIQLYRGLVSH